MSFEDSLKYLFDCYGIAGQKEYCLAPDFYCPSTLAFLEKYLKLAFYKTNPDFSTDKNSYFKQFEKYRPKVTINYSFTGFKLNPREEKEFASLKKESDIIIYDYAHRILDPSAAPAGANIFSIDSIRKHSPFLGSHIIGGNLSPVQNSYLKTTNFYKLKCHILQAAKECLDLSALIFSSRRLYLLGDRIFLLLDDLIGGGGGPIKGGFFSFFLYNIISAPATRECRKNLALLYNRHFSTIQCPLINTLSDDEIKAGEINYYPLFVADKIQQNLLDHLIAKNIFAEKLWELDDLHFQELNSDLYQSFIIFPLNHSIKENDIIRIYKEIKYFLKKSGYLE